MSWFSIILILGSIGIIIPRIRRNGPIAGILFSILPIIFLVIGMLIVAAFWGAVKMAAHNFDVGPKKEQEQWCQDQIADTSVDPCAEYHDQEREPRARNELAESGQLAEVDIMAYLLVNNPYAGKSFEEQQAALDRTHALAGKCPPLNYIESQPSTQTRTIRS